MKKRNLLAVPALGAAMFTEELYRYVFRRRGSSLFSLLFSSRDHDEEYYRLRDENADRIRKMKCTEHEILSVQGHRLKGFYYSFGGKGKRIAFIVHGYRSEHAETAGMFADYYRSRGIDVFCCDHTASGESEGSCIGFDVLETQDCLRWIEYLRREFGEDISLLLHGFSMGGATVLQMSSHCPENVKFIAADSAFSNARAVLSHQVGPMYQPLRLINRVFGGYDLDASDVTESLKRCRIPILFVHGREDRLVPFADGEKLYRMYEGEKDCLFPAGTRHIESSYTSAEAYYRKMDRFIFNYFNG